jgi:NADPH:quinone reductase-like Zn-dependent oxidoreductase
MLKINPLTAWLLLHFRGAPDEGSWLAQNASNSGVGRCLIQLARRHGVRTVNLVRRAELEDELREIGADHVLLDDDGAVDSALEATGGERPLLAANAVGGDSALRLMSLLAEGGTHITYGAMARRALKVPNSFLIFRDLSIKGLWVTRWLQSAPRAESEARYAELAALALEGALVQPVDCEFPLSEARAAVARAAESRRGGKVILRF